jgi:hypothetical protein
LDCAEGAGGSAGVEPTAKRCLVDTFDLIIARLESAQASLQIILQDIPVSLRFGLIESV